MGGGSASCSRQLAGEGLVELRRNRIAAVATPSWAEARDTFDVRIDLERLGSARLSGRLTPEQEADLMRISPGRRRPRAARSPARSASRRHFTFCWRR